MNVPPSQIFLIRCNVTTVVVGTTKGSWETFQKADSQSLEIVIGIKAETEVQAEEVITLLSDDFSVRNETIVTILNDQLSADNVTSVVNVIDVRVERESMQAS